MLSKVNGLADRVLARIVPSVEAAAACVPSAYYYQYKCVENLKYRRQCMNTESCTTSCGPWVSYTHC
jgi:hypothetical protein